MILKYYILQIALFLGAIFLFNTSLYAQLEELELLPGSEKVVYDQQKGEYRLLGTASFRYQGNTMYCDSAIYLEKSKEVFAYNRVHIMKGDVNLYCDSLYYDGTKELAKLWGNVRIRDNEYKLLTDSMFYDTKKDLGIYRNGGKIQHVVNNETLLSKVGYIYTKTKDMFYSGNVKYYSNKLNVFTDTLKYNYRKNIVYFEGPSDILKLNDSLKVETTVFCHKGWYNTLNDEFQLEKNAIVKGKGNELKGDFLYFNPKTEESLGLGHVSFFDSIQNFGFQSNKFIGDSTKNEYLLTDDAILKKVSKKDTFYLHADSILIYLDSAKNKLMSFNAYHGVRFFQKELQGRCDSLVYQKVDSTMQLFYEPIVWVQNRSELKGTKIDFAIENDSLIRSARIHGGATVLMEVDSGAYYNQIGGKEILTLFHNNDIYRTDVKGNAVTVYFPENKEDETDSTVVMKRSGMNRIYASDLRIYVDSNEVKGVTYFEQPEGKFYPIEKINKEEQFIKGFNWRIALKPKEWLDILRD